MGRSRRTCPRAAREDAPCVRDVWTSARTARSPSRCGGNPGARRIWSVYEQNTTFVVSCSLLKMSNHRSIEIWVAVLLLSSVNFGGPLPKRQESENVLLKN